MSVQKIKVLHIIKSLGRGGAEMLLQETLKLHDKSAFEFHYIYFLPWKDQMVQGIRDAGGQVNNFPAGNNIRLLLQARKVIQYIRKNQIDIIHCHLPWAGFLGRWIHMRTRIPVLYTEHNKQERYHAITAFLNNISFNQQTLAIAVSGDVKESIIKNISPSIPVQVILNGVDTLQFRRDPEAGLRIRKENNIPEKAVMIGTIAVFRFQKRLKEWAELFKQVSDIHPGIYGCIIGDGPLNDEIRTHIRELGLESRILMPGLQTEVKPWLSAVDIFMMTSSFEGLPIALLEAMSMECTVVCTSAGGIREVIRNNTDGFTAEVEQWKDLQQPLTNLIGNPSLLTDWGKRARKRVQEDFSMTTMVQETEKLYHDIYHQKHSA